MTKLEPIIPPEDIRPVVRTRASGNKGAWLFGATLLLAAALLFLTLNARRQAATPAAASPDGETISAPPPLALPQSDVAPYEEAWPVYRHVVPATMPQIGQPAVAFPRIVSLVRPTAAPPLTPAPLAAVPQSTPAPPQFATPVSPPRFPDVAPPAPNTGIEQQGKDRVLATRLANPAFTVPKGAVIPAVLETALDSTRPGAARALVQRDVMGFDGTRVLIPRGSRLYGEYGSEVSPGQKRALIRWERLTRPDGVIMDLNSPSADPLGRAGVEGKVDSHFLTRFGSAVVQSVLNIGVGLATRSVAADPVILALPGSTQQVTSQRSSQVQPTLRVSQGTTVSVFVARDLDFSSVDR